MIPGTHPGCVEARDVRTFPQLAGENVCEFDGRLSLAKLGGKYLLYARANRAAHGGQRSVQLTTSTDLIHWSRLSRCVSAATTCSPQRRATSTSSSPSTIQCTSGQHDWALPARAACARLYWDELIHRWKEWSSVTPLMRCAVHGLRAEHRACWSRVVADSDTARRLFFDVAERRPSSSTSACRASATTRRRRTSSPTPSSGSSAARAPRSSRSEHSLRVIPSRASTLRGGRRSSWRSSATAALSSTFARPCQSASLEST